MNQKIHNLNKRQDLILNLIEDEQEISMSQIVEFIDKKSIKATRITISRDLKELLKLNLIIKHGKGRGVTYKLSLFFNLIKPIDVEKYFKTEVDDRQILKNFNFDLLDNFKNIFTKNEQDELEKLTEKYRSNLKKLSKTLIKKEFERLAIDLSWKSSQIEGNTYTLLETEHLINEHKESSGRTKEEALMILNHKQTLDYIYKNINDFKKINIAKLENIHYLLTKDLGVSRNLRKRMVRITGTNYKPLDNQFQIKEALEKTCLIINKEKDSMAKALMVIVLISYIQPFEDGNKRTGRLIGDAILLAYNLCPLSFRSVDKIEYKKSILLFYEQNNINYFKELFIDQYQFAIENYFE